MELSRNITVIPARKRVGNTAASEQRPKLKVAAYCRVSTDSEEQASSYEVQVAHYTQFIQKNPEWELAGIYADDGITGTNTKKREEFNRMIQDCMDGDHHQVHQPVCQKYSGLSEIYPGTEGEKYPGFL